MSNETRVVICPKCFKMQLVQQDIPKSPFKCRLCYKTTKVVKVLYTNNNARKARLWMCEEIYNRMGVKPMEELK